MGYTERSKIYKKIEDIRQRPLLVYFTSNRPGKAGQMGQDALPYFIYLLDDIIKSNEYYTNKKIDVLIMSNGGDPIVSWRIITLLREFFEEISVLIPYTAYSAATLLALGADSIIMNPYGNLGPVDSQLTIRTNGKDSQLINIGYEDIIKFSDFIKDFGVKDEQTKSKMLEKLVEEIKPTSLGFGHRSSRLGLKMGENLLLQHMKNKRKAKKISEMLNKQFYHHGYTVGKKEAKEIGLKVYDDKEIETLIWDIAQDYITEIDMHKPIKNIQVYFQNKIMSTLKAPIDHKKIYSLNDEFKISSLENINHNYCFAHKYAIKYNIDTNLNVNMNITDTGGWEKRK